MGSTSGSADELPPNRYHNVKQMQNEITRASTTFSRSLRWLIEPISRFKIGNRVEMMPSVDDADEMRLLWSNMFSFVSMACLGHGKGQCKGMLGQG